MHELSSLSRDPFPGGSEVKASASSVGNPGLIPGSERSPEEGNCNLLQYSCLENPRDGGVWQAAAHEVARSWTRLSDFTSFLRWASLWFSGKESTCQCKRHRLDPWVGTIPWRRKWQPIPVFLPGKSHGQKSLAGYSPWGPKSRTQLRN